MTMPSIPARKRKSQGSPGAGPDALARAASVKWDFSSPLHRAQAQTDANNQQAIYPPEAFRNAWNDPPSPEQIAMQMNAYQQTDMPAPPAPWQESAWRGDFEPVERETWRDVWADVRGVVLCAAFVLTVLAFGAHVVGLWGK